MQLVKCIDSNNTTTLETGKTYYAFPVNERYAYISKFDREGSNFGCFQLNRFEVVEMVSPSPVTLTNDVAAEVVEAPLSTQTSPVDEKLNITVYEYSYRTKLDMQNYVVFGFESRCGHIAIYKDAEIQELIGVTTAENCIAIKRIFETQISKSSIPFLKAIRFGDLDGVVVGSTAPIVSIPQEDKVKTLQTATEQLSLF